MALLLYNNETVRESNWYSNQVWESEEEEDEFSVLDLLGSDPDILLLGGERAAYFIKIENEVFYYSISDADDGTIEDWLKAFFSEGWKERFQKTEHQTWEGFYSLNTGIAYRGGKGYTYAIYRTI